MKQRKKVIILVLAAILSIIIIGLITINPTKTGFSPDIGGKSQVDNVGYHYNKLSTEEKSIYDAMKKMCNNNIFKTGTEYELIANNVITQDQALKLANGNNSMISKFENAKNAFSLDYPDVFYIDFAKLTIRVTSDGANGYHAYLGAGNNENYFISGITKDNLNAKIAEYENKLGEIVAEVQEAMGETVATPESTPVTTPVGSPSQTNPFSVNRESESDDPSKTPVVNTNPSTSPTSGTSTSSGESTNQGSTTDPAESTGTGSSTPAPSSGTSVTSGTETGSKQGATTGTSTTTSTEKKTADGTTTTINSKIPKANTGPDVNDIINIITNTTTSTNKSASTPISNLVLDKTEYVINVINNLATYKFENDCTSGNEAYLRTAYGALIKREATPIGKSKAIKVVLDRLDVKCVVTEYEADRTLKINAYVEANSKWYDVNNRTTPLDTIPSVPSTPRNSNETISYLATYENYWKIFGNPSFLESTDTTITDKASTELTQGVKNKLMLVSSEIAESQTQAMVNKIASDTTQRILKSNTYNIELIAGNKTIESTKEALKISVKYPQGYDINSKGIEYKAYRYVENDAGGISGVVEVPCAKTPYGLVMECDTFKKTTVVAVYSEAVETSKTVVLSNTIGGRLASSSTNMVKIAKGSSAPLTINADSNYAIEKLFILGKEVALNEAQRSSYALSHNEIENGNNIVYAVFVPKSVLAARTEETVYEAPTTAKITFADTEFRREEGQSIVISPSIVTYGDSYTCQWYKGINKVEGQTKEKLEISSLTPMDSGAYRLAIVTNSGATSTKTESPVVTLIVTDKIEPTPTEILTPTPPVETPPIIEPEPTDYWKPEPTPYQTPNMPDNNYNPGQNGVTTTTQPKKTPPYMPIGGSGNSNNSGTNGNTQTMTPEPTSTATLAPSPSHTNTGYKTDVLSSKGNSTSSKANNAFTYIMIASAIIIAVGFVVKKKVIDKDKEAN